MHINQPKARTTYTQTVIAIGGQATQQPRTETRNDNTV